MGFLNKIIQITLFIGIILLVNVSTFIGVFSSNQHLTKILESAGFYSAASKALSSELSKTVTAPNEEISLAIKNSIALAINADIAKTVIQPGQITFVEWLNSSNSSLQLELDLLPVKNKLTSLSVDPKIRFEITKLLPDNLSILSSKGSDNNLLSQLDKVRYFYKTAKVILPVVWLVVAACSLLLFILNIRKGSKKFTRVCYPALFASVVGLVVATIAVISAQSIVLDSSTKFELNNFQILTKILLVSVQETIFAYALLAGLSVAVIVVARFLYRSRDKAIKHKRK